MATVYDDDLYLDAHESTSAPLEEPCFRGCGVYGSGADLLRHEREEHVTCPHCGEEPHEEYPVSHKPDCPRLAGNRRRPSPPGAKTMSEHTDRVDLDVATAARFGAMLAGKGLSPDQVATVMRDQVQPVLAEAAARVERGEDIETLRFEIRRTGEA